VNIYIIKDVPARGVGVTNLPQEAGGQS